MRKKILFFAEAVTLAHFLRPLALAESLADTDYEVYFASAARFPFVNISERLKRLELSSITTEVFASRIASGENLYSESELHRYAKEDLALLHSLEPDLVVGDLRLSLAASSAHYGVPYIALSNAYWSPFLKNRNFPLPQYQAIRALGLNLLLEGLSRPVLDYLTQRIAPLLLRRQMAPINKLRRAYSQPEFENFFQAFTFGDHTLYADIPSLFAMEELPPNHRFIGPILRSPFAEDVPNWNRTDAPNTAYVNMGSSGNKDCLPHVIEAGRALGLAMLVADPREPLADARESGVTFCSYVDGNQAVKHADLVVCNGGSPSVYQSLSQGVPVLGIASNMDQMLFMQAAHKFGAGLLIRADRSCENAVSRALRQLCIRSSFRDRAHSLRSEIKRYDSQKIFKELVYEIFCRERRVGGRSRRSIAS